MATAAGRLDLGTIREYVAASSAASQPRDLPIPALVEDLARPPPVRRQPVAGGAADLGDRLRGSHRYRRRGRAGSGAHRPTFRPSHRHRPTSARSRSPPGRHSLPPRHSRRRGDPARRPPRDAVDGDAADKAAALAQHRRTSPIARSPTRCSKCRSREGRSLVTSSRPRLSPKTPLGMNGQTEGTANGAIRPAGVSEAVLRPRRSP